MITNFKIFEKVTYKVNDYILIDVDEIKINNFKELVAGDPPDNMAKIINIDRKMDKYYPYHAEFIDKQVLQLRPVEILRKLTPDEIVEFEAKKRVSKYNL
jgi:hypothetical protein